VIRRSKRERNFTCIPNKLIEDQLIGWRDLGLIVFLLSKPDNWEVSVSHLAKTKKSGRDAIYSSLKRLRDSHYIRLKKHSDGRAEWIVYDKPHTEKPTLNEPYPENPDQENPDKAFPTLVKTDKEVKTEEEVKTESRFDEWYQSYPLKKAKEAARKAWEKWRLDTRADELIATLQIQKSKDAMWIKNIGIPYPSTYLNQKRWEDDISPINASLEKPDWARLPADDNKLWDHAKKHGLPDPGRTATNFEYRASLKNVIAQRMSH